jgi:hypothetical protein
VAGIIGGSLRGTRTNAVRVVIATVLLLLPSAAFAQMEKRIASLLIGNRAYDTSVGALKSPHNDIAIVGEALSKASL